MIAGGDAASFLNAASRHKGSVDDTLGLGRENEAHWIGHMTLSQSLGRSQGRRAPSALEYLPDLLAVTIIIFMSMRLFGVGPLTALIWLGAAGALIVYRRVDFGRTLLRWWPLLLAPAMAMFSFIWSDAPGVSFRYGAQLLFTCFLGVLIANVLSPTRFTIALFVGTFAFCVMSILSGRQGASDSGLVLIGLTGSKNQMTFIANILLASSFAVMFIRDSAPQVRLLAPIGALIGAYVIFQGDSATAAVISLASTGLFLAFCLGEKLTPMTRVSLIVVIALIVAPIYLIQDEIARAISNFMSEVLHKDATLTGRTYLWERANELIAQRPLLGYGFQAIWLGETSDTIGLLRWSGKTDGRTFNFHNTYLQMAVDIGIVGASLLALTIIATTVAGLFKFIQRPNVAESFVFSFFITMISRSFTEVVLVPFTSQTLVLFVCATYCFRTATETVQAGPATAAAKPRYRRRPGPGRPMPEFRTTRTLQ